MLRHRLYRWQHRAAPYLFVAPFLVVFGVFGLYPIAKSLVLSLYITNGPASQVWAGLENVRFMLTDPSFRVALGNTALFAACSVGIQLPVSLALAVLLNSRLVRLRNLLRFGFFAPYLVGTVFAAFLFQFVFAPQFGLLNQVLSGASEWVRDQATHLSAALGGRLDALAAHLPVFPADTAWLQKAPLVMPALVLTALWMYAGYNMVYFLAALQAVEKDLYDAAAVDGAGAWQRFRHVTVPGILPVAVFVVVMSFIGSFQLFELPYLLLQNTSGPEQAGLTVVMYLYQKGFEAGDLGYASTVGWTLVAIVVLVTLGGMSLARLVRRYA